MRIAKVKHNSVSEGPRSNTTFWAAGCSIRCAGCFNPELWGFDVGEYMSPDKIGQLVKKGRDKGDLGAAFVGGEPMDQPNELLDALMSIRRGCPGQKITLYSGYTLEELLTSKVHLKALEQVDFLVDGRFDPVDPKNPEPNLGYRGSANQRVIDIPRTHESGWETVIERKWDNIIFYLSNNTFSGPPKFMEEMIGHPEEEVCGKYRD